MTDQNKSAETQGPDELTLLKERAKTLGIKHSGNIGVEALREKINEKIEGTGSQNDEDEEKETAEGAEEATKETPDFSKMTKSQRAVWVRNNTRDEAMKLVRIRIACMNPNKKALPGELFTTGNKFIGTVTKFVPFGEATDEGYHVPNCIYQMLRNRKFLQVTEKRDRRTGTNVTKTRYVPEFSVEVLPPLTEEELAKLATEQKASGRLRDED